MVEHVSELHEIEPPGWIQEPERFVDIPDFFMLGWHRDLETAVYAPASFIPHGALTNARPRRARNGMSGSEDHGRFRELFDELSAALEARGVRGHVYLVGGAPAAATSTSSSSAA